MPVANYAGTSTSLSTTTDHEYNMIDSSIRSYGSHTSRGGGSRGADSNNSDGTMADTSERIKDKISHIETQAVKQLRKLLLLVLVLVAPAVSILVYVLTSNAESDAFESQYTATADKVLDAFQEIRTKIGSISSVGIAATVHGLDRSHETYWPFQTMTNFQQRSATARVLSGALYITMDPIVSETDRRAWEEYSVEQSHSWMIDDDPSSNNQALSTTTTKRIFYYNPKNKAVVDPGPGPYLPGWEISPITMMRNAPVNENLFRRPTIANNVKQCLDTNIATVGSMQCIPSRPLIIDPSDQSTFVSQLQTLGAPFTDLYIPVFDSFDTTNRTIVAIMTAGIHWKSYFQNVLPKLEDVDDTDTKTIPIKNTNTNDNKNNNYRVAVNSYHKNTISSYLGESYSSYFNRFVSAEESYIQQMMEDKQKMGGNRNNKIILVLQNTCDSGSASTYALNGPDATLIGFGDHHDHLYNHYKFTAFMGGKDLTSNNNNNNNKFGNQFEWNGCMYRASVYPSKSFYEEYNTNIPFLMTCGVSVVFMFTGFVFLLYDRLVEFRQKKVLNKAAEQTAIVSSLFPQQIHDKLIKQYQEFTESQKNGGAIAISSTNPNCKTPRELKALEKDIKAFDLFKNPIKESFKNCTVMFGDISGFSEWSSKREPEQIFVLLQTVYKEFDLSAKKRKVFKVETIGDCYLAVTGVPKPQKDHAIIMARFVWECKHKIKEVTAGLARSLGPDTCELTMRAGLHSGPVTAGVLKGDRTRFQLFGDTVNTAARMESTGLGDKIQVSHTTADLLFSAGKGHWIKLRECAVDAKGKGIMQTYWLNPGSKAESSTNSVMPSPKSTLPPQKSPPPNYQSMVPSRSGLKNKTDHERNNTGHGLDFQIKVPPEKGSSKSRVGDELPKNSGHNDEWIKASKEKSNHSFLCKASMHGPSKAMMRNSSHSNEMGNIYGTGRVPRSYSSDMHTGPRQRRDSIEFSDDEDDATAVRQNVQRRRSLDSFGSEEEEGPAVRRQVRRARSVDNTGYGFEDDDAPTRRPVQRSRSADMYGFEFDEGLARPKLLRRNSSESFDEDEDDDILGRPSVHRRRVLDSVPAEEEAPIRRSVHRPRNLDCFDPEDDERPRRHVQRNRSSDSLDPDEEERPARRQVQRSRSSDSYIVDVGESKIGRSSRNVQQRRQSIDFSDEEEGNKGRRLSRHTSRRPSMDFSVDDDEEDEIEPNRTSIKYGVVRRESVRSLDMDDDHYSDDGEIGGNQNFQRRKTVRISNHRT